MPFNTEQHREYQERRRLERLALARARLGGICAVCGSVEDLDFDHVNPKTKKRKISEATNWALDRFLAEVDKCQLLCRQHHTEKSVANGELNGSSRLTEQAVLDILGSSLSIRELAERYEVSQTAIRNVKSRKTWKHVVWDAS